MGAVFLFALAVLELLTSVFPGGGLISSHFAGWHTAYPHSGALAELASSRLWVLGLSTPILIRPGSSTQSFRRHVIIPWCSCLVARKHQHTLKGITVFVFLLAAFASVRTVTLFFTDGLQFAGSIYPYLVLLTAFGLRFGLLNLPQKDEILTPKGSPLEEIGEVDELILYSLPDKATTIHIDYHDYHNEKRYQQYFGPCMVVKHPGVRVLMLQPDATCAETSVTLKMHQTIVELNIHVATTRHLDAIEMDQARLSMGLPTPETIEPEVKRLIHTRLNSAVRNNAAYQELEQHASDYLFTNVEPLCTDLGKLEKLALALETSRQMMDRAAAGVSKAMLETQDVEAFNLYGGLFYCRVYGEVRLSDEAKKAFKRTQTTLQTALTAMHQNRQGDINAVANLLNAVQYMDLPQSALEPFLQGELPGLSRKAGPIPSSNTAEDSMDRDEEMAYQVRASRNSPLQEEAVGEEAEGDLFFGRRI